MSKICILLLIFLVLEAKAAENSVETQLTKVL